jgi:hypothetical protein
MEVDLPRPRQEARKACSRRPYGRSYEPIRARQPSCKAGWDVLQNKRFEGKNALRACLPRARALFLL